MCVLMVHHSFRGKCFGRKKWKLPKKIQLFAAQWCTLLPNSHKWCINWDKSDVISSWFPFVSISKYTYNLMRKLPPGTFSFFAYNPVCVSMEGHAEQLTSIFSCLSMAYAYMMQMLFYSAFLFWCVLFLVCIVIIICMF